VEHDAGRHCIPNHPLRDVVVGQHALWQLLRDHRFFDGDPGGHTVS